MANGLASFKDVHHKTKGRSSDAKMSNIYSIILPLLLLNASQFLLVHGTCVVKFFLGFILVCLEIIYKGVNSIASLYTPCPRHS